MKAKLAALLLSLLVATLGAACATAQVTDGPCREHRFQTSTFTVCTFDPARNELRIVTTGADGANLRGFEALSQSLGGDSRRVLFAMNAGMFDEEGSAIGLLIENGVERHAVNTADGYGNFHLKPNGVFSIDAAGGLHVETTERYIESSRASRWATQSGPMLVMDGTLHPTIKYDGDSRYVRNGVGLAGDRALFVISRGPVSFGRFARFFKDELGCKHALYFDGSVSSLWAPSLGRMDSHRFLGPMIVVLSN